LANEKVRALFEENIEEWQKEAELERLRKKVVDQQLEIDALRKQVAEQQEIITKLSK
jgi:predicted  nucleic acid-binding Zn-ribbon protein